MTARSQTKDGTENLRQRMQTLSAMSCGCRWWLTSAAAPLSSREHPSTGCTLTVRSYCNRSARRYNRFACKKFSLSLNLFTLGGYHILYALLRERPETQTIAPRCFVVFSGYADCRIYKYRRYGNRWRSRSAQLSARSMPCKSNDITGLGRLDDLLSPESLPVWYADRTARSALVGGMPSNKETATDERF